LWGTPNISEKQRSIDRGGTEILIDEVCVTAQQPLCIRFDTVDQLVIANQNK
jgi:hypothetical protein